MSEPVGYPLGDGLGNVVARVVLEPRCPTCGGRPEEPWCRFGGHYWPQHPVGNVGSCQPCTDTCHERNE